MAAAGLGAGMLASGSAEGAGKVAGEAIETAGEVLRDLLKPVQIQRLATAAALPQIAATQEGTRQLRLILRQRTREAKINAKAQMVSTLMASPVAMIVMAIGSTIASRSALQVVAKNTSIPAEVRAAAEAMLAEIPAANIPSVSDIIGTNGSLPLTLPSMPSVIPQLPITPPGNGAGVASAIGIDPYQMGRTQTEAALLSTSPAYMAYRLLSNR